MKFVVLNEGKIYSDWNTIIKKKVDTKDKTIKYVKVNVNNDGGKNKMKLSKK